jgi:hypothetical protein
MAHCARRRGRGHRDPLPHEPPVRVAPRATATTHEDATAATEPVRKASASATPAQAFVTTVGPACKDTTAVTSGEGERMGALRCGSKEGRVLHCLRSEEERGRVDPREGE